MEDRTTVAFSAILAVSVGAGVIALWDEPDIGPINGASIVDVEGDSLDSLRVFDQPAPVLALERDTLVEGVFGAKPVSFDSDDGQSVESPGGRRADDTGPFIDANAGMEDYTYGPFHEVGDFLDPDADDDAGHEAYAPVYDVGNFLDPDVDDDSLDHTYAPVQEVGDFLDPDVN